MKMSDQVRHVGCYVRDFLIDKDGEALMGNYRFACDELGLKETVSQANFVFIDAKRPTNEVAKAMLAEGVVVARAFPPYDTWVRITIGLPAENDQARAALRKVLATKP